MGIMSNHGDQIVPLCTLMFTSFSVCLFLLACLKFGHFSFSLTGQLKETVDMCLALWVHWDFFFTHPVLSMTSQL